MTYSLKVSFMCMKWEKELKNRTVPLHESLYAVPDVQVRFVQ
jgi:hypothetical protein